MLLIFKKRVREIGNRHRSLSGFISSEKINKDVVFESSLERDFIILQEFNDAVSCYLEQPFKVKLANDLSYTPDFIIEYFDESPEVVEIKYSDDPLLKDKKYLEKLDLMREFCKKNDFRFSLYTDVDIRVLNDEYLNNLMHLINYRNIYSFDIYSQDQMNKMKRKMSKILDFLVDEGEMTIKNLLFKLKLLEEYPGELLFYLWYLIANRFISCDLHSKINYDTKIWKD
ncbi:TnsA endonuclease N-terminal domain-containing protein [Marinigracilibium pacificum]|uniref:TnsA endonuclease-like protein n=1 Tax=Marinigracilibium pacificum TaxID=2729599 RepID=A0A848J0J6_9BACT|nr:TnsA endonuclease N-terminal domain-containing protein [Marinigracilibium pacificum]NMM50313.1 hypothetical protein [Marinigracilibium pacificum]